MYEVKACPICGGTRLSQYLQARDHHISHQTFTLQRCEGCNLIVTSPRPAADQLMDYYASEDYVSHTSRATNLLNQAYLLARKFTLRRKVELVSRFVSAGRILDFGCGTGEFLQQAKKANWEIYGVEPAANARHIAQQKLANIHPDIRAIPGQSMHVITLWHVLEHLPDLNDNLDQLTGRLSEAGTIFIAVPNVNSYDSLHYRHDWAGLDVPRHLWHFNQTNMKRLLNKHGLKWIETIPMKLDAYYVSLLSEKYRTHNSLTLPAVYKAIRSGIKSNLEARRSTEYSSLIYVARK